VLRDGASLVFVEVRYRAHVGYGGGAASVDAGKRRKLVRAAQVFLLRNPALSQSPCRFDVVDASGDPDAPDLRWIRAAFAA
jgi:putative endonuclease